MECGLHLPALGPLVGHVTAHGATLWLQGQADVPGMQYGVVWLFDESGRAVENCLKIFSLPRQEALCGVTILEGLQADARYVAYCAILVLQNGETAPEALMGMACRACPEMPHSLPDSVQRAEIRTFPESAGQRIAFLLGSCRYPGLLWPSRRSDRIFAAMHTRCMSDPSIRFVLMNGDQIYADKVASWFPFFKAETPAAFSARYRTAFSSPGMRDLLRTMPTYMILDDHEIENDWNSGRTAKNPSLFENALSAYRKFQWLHSPRNYSATGEVRPGHGDQLYYSFECGGYPFFVIDSRSMRVQDDGRCSLVSNHMLGDPAPDSPCHSRQLEGLCNWLVAQQQQHGNRPKFVVSPSTFVPNDLVTAGTDEMAQRNKCKDDAWAAFPATRRQLLQVIVQEQIQNVVFLCGDAHSSCTAEIHFEHRVQGRLPLVMHSITASAFYWPWPFANGNPDDYVHDSASLHDGFEVNKDVTMHYRAYGFVRDNNFTCVEIESDCIGIQHYSRRGAALGRRIALELKN